MHQRLQDKALRVYEKLALFAFDLLVPGSIVAPIFGALDALAVDDRGGAIGHSIGGFTASENRLKLPSILRA